MNRFIIILLIALIIMTNTTRPGFPMEHGVMGSGTEGSGWQGKGRGSNHNEERIYRLKRLEQKYYEEIAILKKAIKTKSNELEVVLNSPNPDIEKARTLQKEINDLNARVDGKMLNYAMAILLL